MKKKSFFAVLAMIAILVTSCGGGGGKYFKKPLSLKPVKITVVNESSDIISGLNETLSKYSIAGYIEIIDGTYSMIPINDGRTYQIDIKVKSIQKANKGDEFEISESGYTPGGTGLYLVDNVGTIIEEWGGVGQFDLMNKDVLKDFLYSGEGECLLRFENDAYPYEKYVKTPEVIAGFLIKTSAYNKTASGEGTSVTDTSVPASGGDKWDILISSYESLMKQYFKLIRDDYAKQTDIDAVVNKSSDIKTQLNDAQNNMSQAQWVRFVDLEKKWEADLEKFMNE